MKITQNSPLCDVIVTSLGILIPIHKNLDILLDKIVKSDKIGYTLTKYKTCPRPRPILTELKTTRKRVEKRMKITQNSPLCDVIVTSLGILIPIHKNLDILLDKIVKSDKIG